MKGRLQAGSARLGQREQQGPWALQKLVGEFLKVTRRRGDPCVGPRDPACVPEKSPEGGSAEGSLVGKG